MLSSFIFVNTACTPAPPTFALLSTELSLFVFDFSSSSLIEFPPTFRFNANFLSACHARWLGLAPRGPHLALELECINGPLIQIVDTDTGQVTTPFTDVDSHFLAWDADGNIHLRVDPLGDAHLVHVTPNSDEQQFDLPAQTYDMDFAPDGQTLVYSFTRGLGLGSELWAADSAGGRARQLHADADSAIIFAHWSPDGKQIAFIKLPDSATPFPLGKLWIMDADGSHARPLAPRMLDTDMLQPGVPTRRASPSTGATTPTIPPRTSPRARSSATSTSWTFSAEGSHRSRALRGCSSKRQSGLRTGSFLGIHVKNTILTYFYERQYNGFDNNLPPIEVYGMRWVKTSPFMGAGVLNQYFKGPGSTEYYSYGWRALYNGFTGFSKTELIGGTAHVYLQGACVPNGRDFTIAGLITLSFKQFPNVKW